MKRGKKENTLSVPCIARLGRRKKEIRFFFFIPCISSAVMAGQHHTACETAHGEPINAS